MEDMEKMNVEAYVIHTHTNTHTHQNNRSDGSSVSIGTIVQAA